MRVFLIKKKGNIKAVGDYDIKTKTLTVLKGSVVSEKISYSEKFRGAVSTEKNRAKYTTHNVVTQDVEFKSPSTAANFVTGSSSNGLIIWKDEKGTKLKELT